MNFYDLKDVLEADEIVLRAFNAGWEDPHDGIVQEFIWEYQAYGEPSFCFCPYSDDEFFSIQSAEITSIFPNVERGADGEDVRQIIVEVEVYDSRR